MAELCSFSSAEIPEGMESVPYFSFEIELDDGAVHLTVSTKTDPISGKTVAVDLFLDVDAETLEDGEVVPASKCFIRLPLFSERGWTERYYEVNTFPGDVIDQMNSENKNLNNTSEVEFCHELFPALHQILRVLVRFLNPQRQTP